MGSLTPNLIDGLAQMQPGAGTLKKEVDKLSGLWALDSALLLTTAWPQISSFQEGVTLPLLHSYSQGTFLVVTAEDYRDLCSLLTSGEWGQGLGHPHNSPP